MSLFESDPPKPETPGRGGRRVMVMLAVLAIVAVGLGFYALHLKRKVARDEQIANEQQISTLQGNGPPETITLYVANDSDGTLGKKQLSTSMPVERSERARAVLRALFGEYLKTSSTHPIGKDSDVRQVFLMDDGTAIVDTNSAFADTHPSGVLAEELTVASVVLTLNANDSKITRAKILVNGQERETLAGHADLKRFYEASNIGQVVKDMQ
jgi:Sporulation and spore germination